jgi:DNA recombination protein RmuC
MEAVTITITPREIVLILILLVLLLSLFSSLFAAIAFRPGARPGSNEQVLQLISNQLERVFKGLGEMRALATDVGSLKKLLSNVKTRGTWGEKSLENLLDQVIPHQFEANVEVVPLSGKRVDFAIRLPGGKDSHGRPVWLPIDAKLPLTDYHDLINASEEGDREGVKAASRRLDLCIRNEAAAIKDKYIHPPYTTDFAVMFLPNEGLFGEVVQRQRLLDDLQRHPSIMIAGPTTLFALLNSLSMGFRTLAIQKKSSELWELVDAVKTELRAYGETTDKLLKKLKEAQDAANKLRKHQHDIGVRIEKAEAPPEAEVTLIPEHNARVQEESGTMDAA